MKRGHAVQAVDYYRRVAELNPQVAQVRSELAGALIAAEQLRDAVVELRTAVRLAPGSPAGNDLAWILSTAADDSLRDGAEAVRLAEAGCRATGFSEPALLDTLAAAQAEVGQFEQAQQSARRAIDLARQKGNAALEKSVAQRLELYQKSLPYRDPVLKSAPRSGEQP